MGLTFGEFCKLTKLEAGPEVFAFWLRSHLISPTLTKRILLKLIADY